jgi:hypothetical protein
MVAADLNRDRRPDMVVGYVHAAGVVYFNDGAGKRFQQEQERTNRRSDL